MFPLRFKSADEVQLGPPIAAYIKQTYGPASLESHANDLQALDVLRSDCLGLEVHDHALELLLKYACKDFWALTTLMGAPNTATPDTMHSSCRSVPNFLLAMTAYNARPVSFQISIHGIP